MKFKSEYQREKALQRVFDQLKVIRSIPITPDLNLPEKPKVKLQGMDLLIYQKKKAAAERQKQWEIHDEFVITALSSHCTYCGFKGEPSQMGIDRVENSIGYLPDNCVACCRKCNMAKRDMSVFEFKEWIKKTYHFQNQ